MLHMRLLLTEKRLCRMVKFCTAAVCLSVLASCSVPNGSLATNDSARKEQPPSQAEPEAEKRGSPSLRDSIAAEERKSVRAEEPKGSGDKGSTGGDEAAKETGQEFRSEADDAANDRQGAGRSPSYSDIVRIELNQAREQLDITTVFAGRIPQNEREDRLLVVGLSLTTIDGSERVVIALEGSSSGWAAAVLEDGSRQRLESPPVAAGKQLRVSVSSRELRGRRSFRWSAQAQLLEFTSQGLQEISRDRAPNQGEVLHGEGAP